MDKESNRAACCGSVSIALDHMKQKLRFQEQIFKTVSVTGDESFQLGEIARALKKAYT